MNKLSGRLLALLLVPLFLALACQLGSVPNLPDVDLNAAGTQAANAAATAQAAVGNMDELAATAESVAATAEVVAATAAAQSGQALATVQASATLVTQVPGMNVTVDIESLKEKIAALQPDENGNITYTMTEAEMNQALVAKEQAQIEQGQPPAVQGATVSFADGIVTLTGTVTTPVTAQLMVTFRPYVINGVLQFEVLSATVGSVTVPPALLDAAESTLNGTLGELLSQLPAGYGLTAVTVSQGTLTITAARN
ncbi:MAG: hypothetical protein Kow0080_17260 [Candidatus Promineifilaceae bacterium]